MMKKILFLVLALLLTISLPIAALADDFAEKPTDGGDAVYEPVITIGSQMLVSDGADLLSEAEEVALLIALDQISEQYNAQVCVATVSSTEGLHIDDFIGEFYDRSGYGYGADKAGVLLLISMEFREYRILSNGFAADAIKLHNIDNIGNRIEEDLSDGNYATAFSSFVEECDYYLNGYINGFPFSFGTTLVTCVIIGLVVGLIVALILKGQLRSVYKQSRAHIYVKPGSMQLTQAGDYFMYRNVTRRAKQTNSSGSSSGSSRNIGGGSF